MEATAQRRRVECEVIFPTSAGLLRMVPGGEICPCQVVEIRAERKPRKEGDAPPVVVTRYAVVRGDEYWLWFKADENIVWQVNLQQSQNTTVDCDCPAGCYHQEIKCKHRVGTEWLLNPEEES